MLLNNSTALWLVERLLLLSMHPELPIIKPYSICPTSMTPTSTPLNNNKTLTFRLSTLGKIVSTTLTQLFHRFLISLSIKTTELLKTKSTYKEVSRT